jgi:hypothetical protein
VTAKYTLLLLIYFLVVLGLELRALHLLGRSSAIPAIPAAVFALVIVEIGAHFFLGWPGLWFSYFTLPTLPGLLVEMGVP